MFKKNILILIICVLLSAFAYASKPNFVIFLADDCTYREIGAYGGENKATPNIDNFAKESLLFERAYQATAMCSPTRHNLYTGLYPTKSGAYPNHTFANDDVKSICHYLKQADYSVALLGKSHIAPRSVFPFNYLGGGNPIKLEKAKDYMNKQVEKKQSFCLVVASNQPHYPFTLGKPQNFPESNISLSPNLLDTPQTRKIYSKYLAEIEYMDNQFATILSYIDELNIKDNTVVVYLSEQGGGFPFAKWTCYDDGVKSAYIIRYPQLIKAGTRSQAIVEYADIVPTFMELAGLEIPEILDGKSIVENLKDPSKEGKKYTFSMQTTRGIKLGSDAYPIRSISNGKYRYILNLMPDEKFVNVLTEGTSNGDYWESWKELAKTDTNAKELVELYQNRPQEELYDTENDIYCRNNLADNKELEQIKAELKTELLAQMQRVNDFGIETELKASERKAGQLKKKK